MRGFRLIETRRARALRTNATPAELRLRARLRNRRLGGHKFVRQEAIGPYFADFVCREAKLILEIDGETHSTEEERARDAARTAYLEARGYHVARFLNADVYTGLDGVVETVLALLKDRRRRSELTQPLTPALSPQAGRGGRLAGRGGRLAGRGS